MALPKSVTAGITHPRATFRLILGQLRAFVKQAQKTDRPYPTSVVIEYLVPNTKAGPFAAGTTTW